MAEVTPTASVPYAPGSSVFREVDANDAALPTERKAGINCADFDEVVVTATLLNGGTAATVEPHFWSEAKNGAPNGGFVPEATPQVLAVTAAGARRIFRVGHSGSVFFEVTGIAGGAGKRVRLEVSGIPVYGRKGG